MKKWEENLRMVIPYTPGEQPKEKNVIKLNTNENPYPPAPGVKQALHSMEVDSFRKYPDPTSEVLVSAIAQHYHVENNQVFVGVGSDEVLALAFLTCFNSKKPILFPDITYSFYDVWAELYRIPYERQALDENLVIRPCDYKRENGGIIFPNPNAPTGVELPLEQIEEIISANPDVVVIVDEAYIDFGGVSALPLVNKYENVLIAQTFSKSRSLAGLRIGYLIGNPRLIKYISDVKYSFNSYTMNQAALVLGATAIKDTAYFSWCCNQIIDTREWAIEKFKSLGFVVTPSKSNFLFVTHPKVEALKLAEALKADGIYVRHFKNPARISNYLRVSIGTNEEMETLFAFLYAFFLAEKTVD